MPLKATADEVRNPVPLIVRDWATAPTGSEAGESAVIAGTGFSEETLKSTEFDAPPPGVGFVTTTGKLPAVARSLEVRETVNWVELTNVSVWATPLKAAIELGRAHV